MPIAVLPEINMDEVLTWEEYIALRDRDFEDFQEYYEGMNPLDAIESYKFKYKYRVSPDKKLIYAVNADGVVEFGYAGVNYQEFSPDMEITYVSDSSSIVYKPVEYGKGKFDIEVRVRQYAFLKDGRTVIIDEII